MNSNPRVTVLMAIYNGERYLHQAIGSILHQSFTNFEFLIIDDGSTDCSAEIIRSYKDSRIRLFHNINNLGLVPSLNRGLDLARGEFIARMDADDISHPERLSEQLAFLDNHPHIGLVGTNFILINSEGITTSGPILPGFLSDIEIQWKLLWENPIAHPSVMFRSSIAQLCGGYPSDYAYAEDYALWLQMGIETKMAVLAQPLLFLRKHEGNVTILHLEEHIGVDVSIAQKGLALRIGYLPSLLHVRLLRYHERGLNINPGGIKEIRKILLDAFKYIVKNNNSNSRDLIIIKNDLVDRLLKLVTLYGIQDRMQSIITLMVAISLLPKRTISLTGLKAFYNSMIR